MLAGTPTLDQLKVFVAVAETGSFAAAARKLGRATSAVSYSISNLELQLGMSLLDRGPTRRAVITEAGLTILCEARVVSDSVQELRSKATGLLGGLEAEVSLVVDALFPCERLMDALVAFQLRYPNVRLKLEVQPLGAVPQLILDRRATLGITGPIASGIKELRQINLGTVEMVPVAAPDHPLLRKPIIGAGAGTDHLQIVLSDRSELSRGRDFQVTGIRTWRIADIGAKHALILSGLGWGNMPEPLVAEDLRIGRLVRLNMPDMGTTYFFSGAHRRDTALRPAALWLLEHLAAQCQASGGFAPAVVG